MEYVTVHQYIDGILKTLPQPYGPDVVDQVFLAIENNPEWLAIYNDLVHAHGKGEVDNSITYNIMGQAGLKSLDRREKSRSQLIETYAELGNS